MILFVVTLLFALTLISFVALHERQNMRMWRDAWTFERRRAVWLNHQLHTIGEKRYDAPEQ